MNENKIIFDNIESLDLKYSINFLNEEETPMEELTKDIIAIMNIFVAKMNGLRKYKKMITDDIKNTKN
jgi:predicted site-specific integrase-resolvase